MSDDKKKQILARMQRYCASEDRSTQQIKEKLFGVTDISEEEIQEIIDTLFEDGFLDEERFLEAYIRSKINQNKWGRLKIRNGLIRHRMPEEMIDRGLESMNKQVYSNNLKNLLLAKQTLTDDPVAWMRYLHQKGYEYDEIMEVVGN